MSALSLSSSSAGGVVSSTPDVHVHVAAAATRKSRLIFASGGLVS